MSDTSVPSYPRRWKKPPLIENRLLRWCLWFGAAIYLALALGTMEINWGRVAEGLPRGQRFIAAFFPPDFVSRWDSIVDGILESRNKPWRQPLLRRDQRPDQHWQTGFDQRSWDSSTFRCD